MSTIHYTTDHEYVRIEGEAGVVGITDYAQNLLGDIVFIELPPIGETLVKGAEAATVESVKAASEVNAPVSGEVIEVNTALQETPGLVNEDPFGRGWILKIRLSDAADLESLMDETAYLDFVKTLA